MNQLICSTSLYSLGCTFLDWSINYLSGKTKYFHHQLGSIDLINNPISKINAHEHQKNHPSGFERSRACVQHLQQHSDFNTVYPFPLLPDLAAHDLKLDIYNLDKDTWKKITDYQISDFNKLLCWMSDNDAKIIFVSLDKDLALYHNANIRSLDRSFYKPEKFKSVEEVRQAKDLIFFKESCNAWKESNLTEVWDVRERLALSTRPLELPYQNVNLSIPHYWLDSRDLWYNGVRKIKDIMSWLELPIDSSRLDHWENVYYQWQKMQLKSLEFQHTYKHIVESIINGWSYPIDLTFDQEVVIQHCLIYQHGLNFKTWRLEKFPNNTLELHSLLEPNIHTAKY